MPVFSVLIASTLLSVGGGYNVLLLNAVISAGLAAFFSTTMLGLVASSLILTVTIAAAILLRASTVEDAQADPPRNARRRRLLARVAALALALPLAFEMPMLSPLGVALVIIACGIANTITQEAVSQCVGLFCAVNGVLVMSALTAHVAFIYAGLGLWTGIFMIARLALPKIAYSPLEVHHRD